MKLQGRGERVVSKRLYDSNKSNNKEENLKTLCANCHRLAHFSNKISIDWERFVEAEDNTTASQEVACSGGQCEV